MEEVGKLVTCDRCGKQIFLKTKQDKFCSDFEPLHDGWQYWGAAVGTLCPECSKKYTEMLEEFKRGDD